MIRWIIFIAIFLIIDFYAFQAVRTAFKSRGVNLLYILASLIVLGNFIYQLQTSDKALCVFPAPKIPAALSNAHRSLPFDCKLPGILYPRQP